MKKVKYIHQMVSVIGMCLLLMTTLVGKETPYTRNVYINDKLEERGEVLPVVDGQVLIPIEKFAKDMEATEVEWYPGKDTLRVEIPFFSESRRYLSYLAGLGQSVHDKERPLPERVQQIPLPSYPLEGLDSGMIHEHPITITLADGGMMMPYAAYNYQIEGDTLYLGMEWLNTMFLAKQVIDEKDYYINYPTEQVIEERIKAIEDVLRPRTPEEALNLWVKGQQTRSGSLQYITLSPKLQEQVVATGNGWVTGGSSPSVGKLTIQKAEKTKDGEVKYTILLDEMLQGKVSGEIKQKLTLKSYQKGEETYWQIISVKGNTDYSILD